MRYNKYYILVLFSFLLVINSCRDEDTLVLNPDTIPHGNMVILEEVTSPVLNVTDLANSSYDVTLVAPSDNIDTYILEARLISTSTSDWAEIKKITSFPGTYDLSVSAEDLASAFGIELADFLPGDQIDFNAYVIGDNGDTATWDNLDQDLGTNPGQKQGFQFTTYVSCPFNAGESAGTYKIVRDDWETIFEGDSIFTVVAGPGENQITLVDLFNHPNLDGPGVTYDVVIDVDPSAGTATVDKQAAWNWDNWVPGGYGTGSIEGTGFVFSCTGLITLSLEYSVGAGSWGGGYILVAEKQ